MHGNAWEWVEDCYDENAYKNRLELLVDPVVSGSCQFRVLRGGSAWNDDPRNLRSANRDRNEPENRDDNIGFRCVRRPRRLHAVSWHRAGPARTAYGGPLFRARLFW